MAILGLPWKHSLLPPANEVCEGYVFTRVCHSVHRGVSRPRPRVEVGGGSGWGEGVQAHTRGVQEGGGVSQHALRQTPPSRRLLLRGVCILLQCILVITAEASASVCIVLIQKQDWHLSAATNTCTTGSQPTSLRHTQYRLNEGSTSWMSTLLILNAYPTAWMHTLQLECLPSNDPLI